MTAAVEQLIDEIGRMNLEQLREFWRQRYGAPPPLRSVCILKMQLAWRVQAEVQGGLDHALRRALARTGMAEPEGKHLGLGATLTRTWRGKHIEVMVVEDGFSWDGNLFPSLSAAASAIAGSKWNGPRFFGLRSAA